MPNSEGGGGRKPKRRSKPVSAKAKPLPKTAEGKRAAEIYSSLYSSLTELRACRLVRDHDDSREAQKVFCELLQRSTPLTQDQKLVHAVIQQIGGSTYLRSRQRPAYGLWSDPQTIVHLLQLENRLSITQDEAGQFRLGPARLENSPQGSTYPERGQIVVPRGAAGMKNRKDPEPKLGAGGLIRAWKSLETAAAPEVFGGEPDPDPEPEPEKVELAIPMAPITAPMAPVMTPPMAPDMTAAPMAPVMTPMTPAPLVIEGLVVNPHGGIAGWQWGDHLS
jgi:hypothetical protein